MRILIRFVLIGLLALMLTGCTDKKGQIMDGDGMFNLNTDEPDGTDETDETGETAKPNETDETGETAKPGETDKKEEGKEEMTNIENEGIMDPMAFLTVVVGDRAFSVDLEDNPSAQAFKEKLSSDPITLTMHDYGSFEKVGDLPWELPRNDEKITTKPGDLILYQGDQITVYYAENTWEFTKLGSLNAEEDEIVEAFGGKDDITAEFFLEWTE